MNNRRDPRVAISLQYPERHPTLGIQQYAVLYGVARVDKRGARELIDRLAKTYVGPGASVTADNLPPGYITRVTVQRIAGVGPGCPIEDKYGIAGRK